VKARFLIPLVVFLLLVGLFMVGLKLDPREVPSPLIDKPVPPFSLPDLHDESKRVSAEDFKKHKVSLFNVWASWCVACRQEHPLLVEISRQGIVPIYGLNYKDKRPDVYGVPETFVVDGKGIIRYKQIGPITEEAWQKTILPLIEKIRAEEG